MKSFFGTLALLTILASSNAVMTRLQTAALAAKGVGAAIGATGAHAHQMLNANGVGVPVGDPRWYNGVAPGAVTARAVVPRAVSPSAVSPSIQTLHVQLPPLSRPNSLFRPRLSSATHFDGTPNFAKTPEWLKNSRGESMSGAFGQSPTVPTVPTIPTIPSFAYATAATPEITLGTGLTPTFQFQTQAQALVQTAIAQAQAAAQAVMYPPLPPILSRANSLLAGIQQMPRTQMMYAGSPNLPLLPSPTFQGAMSPGMQAFMQFVQPRF